MNRTRTLAAAVLVPACFWPFPAQADLAMSILSETYHVRGSVGREDYEWDEPGDDSHPEDYHFLLPGESHSYDVITSHPPAFGSVSMPARGLTIDSLDAWSLATRVRGYGQEESRLFLRVATDSTTQKLTQRPFGPNQGAGASATLDVQFRLTGSSDSLQVVIGAEAARHLPGGVSLTSGDTTWLQVDAGYDSPPWEPSQTIPIDTSQIYTLSMSLEHGDDYASWTVDFLDISNVTVVTPVPGAAVLGLLGLACAGWRLRKTPA